MNKYDDILEMLFKSLVEIETLTSFDNLSVQNAKKSRLLGKKIDDCARKLVNNEEGIEKYKLWLTSDNISLKWNSALNLFHLYPKKCLISLIECEEKCLDKLLKSSMNDVIINYSKGISDDNVFIKRLISLYNKDDLLSLNRE